MKTAMHAQMSQHIGMTPQLLQSIRLLHLSAIEVEQEVAQALDENPLLERVEAEADAADDAIVGDATSIADTTILADDVAAIDDTDTYTPGEFLATQHAASDDYDPFDNIAGVQHGGIRGAIREQLQLEFDSTDDFDVACFILDNTDDAGYLELALADLVAQATEKFGVTAHAVECLRQRILRCDPAGFGASDLRECLLVQLSECDAEPATLQRAILIVANHLSLLAQRNFSALAELIDAPLAETRAAIDLVRTLDPKPGANLSSAEGRVIIPDVIVSRRAGGWHVALNATAAPRVRVEPETERLLATSGNDDASRRMRELLQDARWMTRGLSMRYETLLRTTRAVIERQTEFLEKGEEFMRPLILREVAATIGMHESSISRITSGKYMQTPRGTFELKYFFSARLEGAQVAGVAVRAMVKRLIDTENRAAPLADDTIVALLARRGVRVARRTVAKYRDLMDIGPAKQRGVMAAQSSQFAASA